jgi:hypothetical protein
MIQQFTSHVALLPPSADRAWDSPNPKLGFAMYGFRTRLCDWVMDE